MAYYQFTGSGTAVLEDPFGASPSIRYYGVCAIGQDGSYYLFPRGGS